MQPRPLAPQHQAAVLAKVKIHVIRCPALIQPHNPDVPLLHRLQRPRDIRHPRNPRMFRRPSRRLRHHRRQRSRPPIRHNHPIDPRPIRRPQQRPQIMRILHPIQRQEEMCARPRRSIQQVLQHQKLTLPQKRHNPLVLVRLYMPRQRVLRLSRHPNPRHPAKLQHRLKPRIPPRIALPRHAHMIDLPNPRPDRLLHRVKAI